MKMRSLFVWVLVYSKQAYNKWEQRNYEYHNYCF